MHFHISQNGRQYGPLTVDEIRKRMVAGDFAEDDLAWTEGMDGWKPLKEALPEPLTPPPLFQQASAPKPISLPARSQAASWELSEERTSGLAVTSLVCGLLGFVLLFPSLLAVIFGHVARGAIARSGGSLKGGGMALAGLIMGYVMMALIPVIGILAALMVPVLNSVSNKAQELRAAKNAHQLVLGLQANALDHDGAFPPDLETLFAEGILNDPEPLKCPLGNEAQDIGWEYLGAGIKNDAAPDTVLLRNPSLGRGGIRIEGRVDGSVETMRQSLPGNQPGDP